MAATTVLASLVRWPTAGQRFVTQTVRRLWRRVVLRFALWLYLVATKPLRERRVWLWFSVETECIALGEHPTIFERSESHKCVTRPTTELYHHPFNLVLASVMLSHDYEPVT